MATVDFQETQVRDAIVVNLHDARSLLTESEPDGQRAALPMTGAAAAWDAVGAILGEPGVARALRLVLANPYAKSLVLRLPAAEIDAVRLSGPSARTVAASDRGTALLSGLRSWCEAKIADNTLHIRMFRSLGLRSLAGCFVLLALALGAAWLLQNPDLGGAPGPLRTLVAEAIVIAGWVVMWRPVEMLVFDPMKPSHENRLIRRLLALRWSIEVA